MTTALAPPLNRAVATLSLVPILCLGLHVMFPAFLVLVPGRSVTQRTYHKG